MHTDRSGNTCRQKYCAKGSGKEVKIQEFMNRGTTNVEPELYDYTNNNNGSLRKKNWKLYRENIRYIHYKRQLYLEHHT